MADPEVQYGAEHHPDRGKTRIYADVDHMAIQATGARFKVVIMEQIARQVADQLTAEVATQHREAVLAMVTPQAVADAITQRLASAILDALAARGKS